MEYVRGAGRASPEARPGLLCDSGRQPLRGCLAGETVGGRAHFARRNVITTFPVTSMSMGLTGAALRAAISSIATPAALVS